MLWATSFFFLGIIGQMRTMTKNLLFPFLFLLLIILAGCATPVVAPTPTVILPTETLPPPTPTSLPMAIRINGEGLLLSDYEEEYKRLEDHIQAMGKTTSTEEIKKMVLDDLTGTMLLDGEAKNNGYEISESDVDTKINGIRQQIGGDDIFLQWMQSNHFTLESLRRSIERSSGAEWQKEKIMDSVGETAEQIHARQILFILETSAMNYRQRVDSGADFAGLAAEADPVTKGDLGWFPKGYLLQPEVEEAVFKLQVGEVSQVIKSSIGFHLIQVIEHDPARKLSPEARKVLQNNAVKDWVTKAKAGASIELMVP